MHQPVAHRRLMNITRLRVVNFERLVLTVAIRLCDKVAMERKDIAHQAMPKILHIFLAAFATDELLPCSKQILDRNDILIDMSELSTPRATPPRTNVACY